ncbi:alpha/beta hydrolase [Arthrobacter gengyunqii]|uniref:Alpha/beta hydrolase n=1 Tax=Arthrobacter gengyunqii TaxID=2886940 RepID=A0A9X1M2A8_9MICC|nr:DUF6270 domain-containing protein [Arthrobacter gengyunqii]MCC3269916.1 alpha/beta hydrolase [Arthrobacter gengyunqii]UOY95153.1 alpha/beta hydrolase [Arthrobacter gengyunqii]
MNVITYGSGAAWELVHTYSLGSVHPLGHIGRQSLISAMNGASLDLNQTADNAGSRIDRVVREDIQASLMERIRQQAEATDLLIWDINDERFGVVGTGNSTYVTRSPQLTAAHLSLPRETTVIVFGSDEHFALWQQASNEFVSFLKEQNLLEKTVLLDIPWASHDERGNDIALSYGLSPSEANSHFERYHRHLADLGVQILSESKTVSAADHRFGPAPFNFHDTVYHSVAQRLHQSLAETGRSTGTPGWNWDEQHKTEIKIWTSPQHANFGAPGRTEHLIRPRTKKTEVFPARLLVENTGSDTLLVISHGALPRSKYTLPRFEWMATLAARDENRIFLSDTALEGDRDFELAWFTGNAADDLTSRYADLVRKAAGELGATKIVFMGGSGGGFASLSLAAKVPGSRALVFNPQTIIRNYWHKSVDKYQKTLFPELNDRTQLASFGTRVDVTRVVTPAANQIIYVQNDNDTLHVEKHLSPYAARNGLPAETGVSSTGNVSVVMEHFAEGHNMPYREVLLDFVDIAVSGWNQPLLSWDNFPESSLTRTYRTVS